MFHLENIILIYIDLVWNMGQKCDGAAIQEGVGNWQTVFVKAEFSSKNAFRKI